MAAVRAPPEAACGRRQRQAGPGQLGPDARDWQLSGRATWSGQQTAAGLAPLSCGSAAATAVVVSFTWQSAGKEPYSNCPAYQQVASALPATSRRPCRQLATLGEAPSQCNMNTEGSHACVLILTESCQPLVPRPGELTVMQSSRPGCWQVGHVGNSPAAVYSWGQVEHLMGHSAYAGLVAANNALNPRLGKGWLSSFPQGWPWLFASTLRHAPAARRALEGHLKHNRPHTQRLRPTYTPLALSIFPAATAAGGTGLLTSSLMFR